MANFQDSRTRPGGEAPDFSQPGSDGKLPSGFEEWKWGVTYTVGPELVPKLDVGREYRMTTAVRRKIARSQEFNDYGDLYRRARAVGNARLAEFASEANEELPHTWIISQGWRRINIGGPNDLLIAFQTTGSIYVGAGSPNPEGEAEPEAGELMTPGGATNEMLASQASASRLIDEICIEFDHRDPSCANPDIFLFSYGERLRSCEGIDFQAIVDRAERRARLHSELLEAIVRREWMYATNPDIAVVHVYFQVKA